MSDTKGADGEVAVEERLLSRSAINMTAFKTIVAKEVRRYMRIWVQTLIPPAITMSLYFVIFGKMIGSRVGEMGGFDYIQFIVPGLIMMSVITNSYANVASSFYSSKFQRNIEELLVSPVSNFVILFGFVIGGATRGLLVGVIVTLVSLFFTDLQIMNPVMMLLVLVATATLFATAGFINGLYAKSFDDISIVPTFILTPLTYLGGVFYSLTLLPDIWRSISMLNPIVYMVNTFRYSLLGVSDVEIVFSLIMIVLFTGGLLLFALTLLNRGYGLRS